MKNPIEFPSSSNPSPSSPHRHSNTNSFNQILHTPSTRFFKHKLDLPFLNHFNRFRLHKLVIQLLFLYLLGLASDSNGWE